MNAKHRGAIAAALLTAGALTACGTNDDQQNSSIDFSPITGDDFSTNPGAWQTDGVPVPEKTVAVVGDPVAAQAVANAGLEQGTVTASFGDTTVYYPAAPPVPGLPVAPQEVAPPPPQLTRPVNTRPWNYTPHQISVYRTICETGRWNDWEAGAEVQSQTCWTLYGRRLGVRPWYPGQPKPWERPTWPKPWFDPGFRADVPVMWVYPRDWTRPRPQPVISVSIGLNVPQNPHARPNPRYRDAVYQPVWAVTPGRPVAARDQARVVAPWLPYAAAPAGRYLAPPVYPGTVLPSPPPSGRADVVTALPGGDGEWNPNRDRSVTGPSARALVGATVYNATRADLAKALGEDVDVRVGTTRARPVTTTPTTTRTTTTGSGRAATSIDRRDDGASATTRSKAGTSTTSTTGAASTTRTSGTGTSGTGTSTTTSPPKPSKPETTGSSGTRTTTTAPKTSTTRTVTTTKPPTRTPAASSATTTTPAR